MRKFFAAGLAVVFSIHLAGPALAGEIFNRTTLLGWHQQTGPAVVAYFRAPIGPRTFEAAPIRAGFAITGPRSFSVGNAPMHSQGPRLLDFSFAKRSGDLAWTRSLNVGGSVAWTSDPTSLKPGQLSLMDGGLSWIAVGAIAAGLAIGTFALIEQD
jgi:hypothetical protein